MVQFMRSSYCQPYLLANCFPLQVFIKVGIYSKKREKRTDFHSWPCSGDIVPDALSSTCSMLCRAENETISEIRDAE
jgi:hypothetical protein